jgi:hypothetical protein
MDEHAATSDSSAAGSGGGEAPSASRIEHEPPPEGSGEPSILEALQEWLGDIFGQAMDVIWRPAEFFEAMPEEGGLGRATAFALGMGAVAGIVGFILRVLPGFGALFSTPFAAFACTVVGAFVIHVLAMLAGGKGRLEGSYLLAAYLMTFFPLIVVAAVLPYLDVAVAGYGLYVLLVGVVPVHRLEERRAWSVFGTVGAVALLSLLLGSFLGAKSPLLDEIERLRAQQQRMVEEVESRLDGLRPRKAD